MSQRGELLSRLEYHVLIMVIEEQAARTGRKSTFKEAAKCAEVFGLEARKCQIEKLENEIRNDGKGV